MANKKMTTCKSCGAEISVSAKHCPQCGAKNKKPIYKKWWFWLIIFIILVSAFGSNGSSKSSSESSASHSSSSETANSSAKAETVPATKATEAPIEYTSVSVSQMMKDLKGNAMKAQNSYKGQYLEITGKLNNIDADGKYISLAPSDEAFAIVGVHCNISNDTQKAQVMNMKEDDIVTLRGKCTDVGEIMGYTLKIDSIDGYDAAELAAKPTAGGWIVCDASTLVNDLNENAMKAQAMYKGQKISVTGKLSNIDADGKYISIRPIDNPYSFVSIQCFIKSDDIKSAVMDLSIDDIITVKGLCKDVGEVLGYSINIEELTK